MQKKSPAFTLIETVVAIGVFSIFLTAVGMTIQQVLENIGFARARTVALTLGQEKLELVRNLPYDNVGTIGGIPNGPITQVDNTTIDGQEFTTKTDIVYIDDPYDNVAPTDAIPADYKRVRVEVTWGGVFPSRKPVTFVTTVVPKGIESNPGGGTLYIQVLNALGVPVANANVTIVNQASSPQININTLTNAQGNVIIPGAPACVNCYQITASKAGFSTDRTYGTQEVANPLLPHATVLAGQVTQNTFTIDQLGSITVKSVGPAPAYSTAVNVIFTLRGSKIIGHDTLDNPVYKYSYSTTTGGGTVGMPNLEWDNYTVDLTSSNYTLVGSSPIMPIALSPQTTQLVTIVTEPQYAASLRVIAKNQIGELQASVAANLRNSLGYDSTKVTPATGSADLGQVLFNSLSLGNYTLIASLSGYPEATKSVTITGNNQTTVVFNN